MSKVGVDEFRPAIVSVTKRLANSAVRAGIGITTTVGRFSTGSIRTCKGLTSCSQKILVILHSLKLIEFQLQLKLTLLSGVFVCACEIGFSIWCIQMMSSAFPHSRSLVIMSSFFAGYMNRGPWRKERKGCGLWRSWAVFSKSNRLLGSVGRWEPFSLRRPFIFFVK